MNEYKSKIAMDLRRVVISHHPSCLVSIRIVQFQSMVSFFFPVYFVSILLMADDWIPAALSSTTGYGQKRRYEERRRPF